MNEDASKEEDGTLLSYLLKSAPHDAFPVQPQTLHPFGSPSADAPLAFLRNIVNASAVLNTTLQAYSVLPTTDHKLVSILRQSTALIHSLHVSNQDTRRRIDALKARDHGGIVTVYGEPIPLDKGLVVDWCISRIQQWGRKIGMEIFKDEEKNGHMTLMLGGKVLVVEVDFAIQRRTSDFSVSRISVSNVKTSHALPSGNSGNALAERSASLDTFILQTWNRYLAEVQSDDVESNMRAAYLAKDIQSHLSRLMKLDVLASREGDKGIRWFNDIGVMSLLAERLAKTEIDSISSSTQSPTVNLDVFLSRAHALAVPYLVAPSISFLVYLSPLAYYSLCASKSSASLSNQPIQIPDPYSKLDVPLSILRTQFIGRESRPAGVSIATLTLTTISNLPTTSDLRIEQRPHLGRPHFRLPGTSLLAALDHIFLVPLSTPSTDLNSKDARDVWMLDFTDDGQSEGLVMTHSRMREIQSIVDPRSAMSGDMALGMQMQMQMPPLPGSWVGLLVDPVHPPSERYIAVYKSPSDMHPPLRLRLTAPSEAGFLLQKVPVRSLKEVYGILEIVRDQCWINEILKTVQWVAEDLAPDTDGDIDGGDLDAVGATEEELSALLKGALKPRRIPVNVFLPTHPPIFPSNGMYISDEVDPDADVVPGLASISMSTGASTPAPCIALAFALHMGAMLCPSQAALVLRHERTRRRGVRVDANVSMSVTDGMGGMSSERPPAALIDELEEGVRRGGAFGVAGRVWTWAVGKDMFVTQVDS